MNKKLYSILCILFFLPGCFSTSDKPSVSITRTYFIQALFDSEVLTSIKKEITPLINQIIKEELELDQENSFEFFLPKTRQPQALTLYYVDDMQENGLPLMLSVLDGMHLPTPHSVSISQKIDDAKFYGDQQDELVILMDDHSGELSHLNLTLKATLQNANNVYKHSNTRNLYNVAKSERFPFVPHIGLGRIRSNSIKQNIKDASLIQKTFDRIKERILDEIKPIIQAALTAENKKITFNGFCVFDLEKKECIKEYKFKI